MEEDNNGSKELIKEPDFNNRLPFTDSPALEDELDSEEIQNGLAEIIKMAAMPFVLAVIGEWGSGKTTLIDHTLKKIENHYEIIKFNAWSHSKGKSLLQGFFDHLETQEGEGWPDLKKQIRELARAPITTAAIRGLGSFGGPIGALFAEIAAKSIAHKHEKEKKSAHRDEVESFIENFKEVADTFKEKKKPLLFFIDDLDRCTPPEALDLIDDVKVYLTIDAPVIFIVALDKRTLSMGIKAKYGVDVEITVDDYIQKIFSYAVNMPAFPDLKQLIENISNSLNKRIGEVDLVGIAHDIIKKTGITNLRIIKRIIKRWIFLIPQNPNNFLRSAKVKQEGITSEPIKIINFILFLCMLFEVYPEYFETLSFMKNPITSVKANSQIDEPEIEKGVENFLSQHLTKNSHIFNFTDTNTEAKKIRMRERLLSSIIDGLISNPFLDGNDNVRVRGYRRSIPIMINSVRLGLPLIK